MSKLVMKGVFVFLLNADPKEHSRHLSNNLLEREIAQLCGRSVANY